MKKLMKKITLSILILMVLSHSAIAATSSISDMEKYLFGYEYKTENDSKRLDRLEEYIYGKKTGGAVQSRTAKLSDDLNLKAIESEKIAKAQSKGDVALDKTPDYLPKSDASIKYPIVDKMEQKVFSTTYANDDVYKRVDRLEKKIFSKSNKGTLDERVDKLRSAVKLGGQNYSDAEDDTIASAGSSDDYMSSPDNYNYYSPSSTPPPQNTYQKGSQTGAAAPSQRPYAYNRNNIAYDLSPIEKSVLKTTYPTDDPNARLNRLENKIFGITFPQDDFDSRAQRITAAASAQKNSTFLDNGKMMRHINTGIQIGGILLMILAMIL